MAIRSCSLFPPAETSTNAPSILEIPEIFNPLSPEYSSLSSLQNELTDERFTTTRKTKALGIAAIAGAAGVAGFGVFSAPLFRTVTETLLPHLDGDYVGDDYRPLENSPWQSYVRIRKLLEKTLTDSKTGDKETIKKFIEDTLFKQMLIDDIQMYECKTISALIYPNSRGDRKNFQKILIDFCATSYDVGIKPEYFILSTLQRYAYKDPSFDLEKMDFSD